MVAYMQQIKKYMKFRIVIIKHLIKHHMKTFLQKINYRNIKDAY